MLIRHKRFVASSLMRALLIVVIGLSAYAGGPAAESLMENGHWKRARDVAETEYKAHPNDAHATYLLARVRHEFGNLGEAVKLAEAAARLDPKSSVYHRELGEAFADQAGRVSMFKQLGLARQCRAEFEAALAIAPNDPDNLFDQVQYFEEAPGVVGGDRKKAAQFANDLMKIDAARGYLALAYLARKEKEDSKLEGLYQTAVESNPRNYEARISLAAYYLPAEHSNPALAGQNAKAALDLNPDRIDAYRVMAAVLTLEKRYDDAAKLIARAEAAIPDDLSPLVYAARALLRDGAELPKAEAYLKKYLDQTKEPEVGAPLIAGAHWSLGLVYEKEGRKADARNELETALRLKPDFEPARRDLKRVKS
jgi:tetratricopeptide (TPR) repeat protein